MVERVLREDTGENETDLLNAALDLVQKVARGLREMQFVTVGCVR